MKILILNFLILLLIKQQINFVNACSCLNLTVKDIYCRSNWAAHTLILKREEIKEGEIWDWKLRYTAKFLKGFKGEEEDCEYAKNNKIIIYLHRQMMAFVVFILKRVLNI
uniref:Uncharacterized protein n=1 Tax=Meloidogyne enterolobii TaxID=390850 RepID=A0A6V7TMD8_MELEN|nr:unnamed protein product [Meloidogyne enterolobii]